jgi:hypothetical protein
LDGGGCMHDQTVTPTEVESFFSGGVISRLVGVWCWIRFHFSFFLAEGVWLMIMESVHEILIGIHTDFPLYLP